MITVVNLNSIKLTCDVLKCVVECDPWVVAVYKNGILDGIIGAVNVKNVKKLGYNNVITL